MREIWASQLDRISSSANIELNVYQGCHNGHFSKTNTNCGPIYGEEKKGYEFL